MYVKSRRGAACQAFSRSTSCTKQQQNKEKKNSLSHSNKAHEPTILRISSVLAETSVSRCRAAALLLLQPPPTTATDCVLLLLPTTSRFCTAAATFAAGAGAGFVVGAALALSDAELLEDAAAGAGELDELAACAVEGAAAAAAPEAAADSAGTARGCGSVSSARCFRSGGLSRSILGSISRST